MLQGSLDNFALSEVLGLLSNTAKTGRFRISGDRGTGSLWLADGQLTAAEASKIPGVTGIEDVMFELLRYESGNFTFAANDRAPDAGAPEVVDFVLHGAQDRLHEWREIEVVVPSLQHQLAPINELPHDEVSINREEWATLVAVGEASAVEPVCTSLGLGEVDGSRRVKGMIERGLLTITDPMTAGRSDESALVADEPVAETMTAEPVAAEPVAAEPVAAESMAFEAPVAESMTFEAPVADEVAPPAYSAREEMTPAAEFTAPEPSTLEPAPVESVDEILAEVPSMDSTSEMDAAMPPPPTAPAGDRPPMPPPPSPAEIDSFTEELNTASPFESDELDQATPVGADDDDDADTSGEVGSLLMRYLKNDG